MCDFMGGWLERLTRCEQLSSPSSSPLHTSVCVCECVCVCVRACACVCMPVCLPEFLCTCECKSIGVCVCSCALSCCRHACSAQSAAPERERGVDAINTFTSYLPAVWQRALFNQIRFSRHPHSGGGTALKLSNPQVAPIITPKADIGCTESH
jgi:hypothetical protein